MSASSTSAPERVLSGLAGLLPGAGVPALLPPAAAPADSAPLHPAAPSPATVARVWAVGSAEPAAVQLSRSDTTPPLQAPGAVGVAADRPPTDTTATVIRVPGSRVVGGAGA